MSVKGQVSERSCAFYASQGLEGQIVRSLGTYSESKDQSRFYPSQDDTDENDRSQTFAHTPLPDVSTARQVRH
jgi:hypothetical protein